MLFTVTIKAKKNSLKPLLVSITNISQRFIKAQQEFAELPAVQQPEVMSDISGLCMDDILHYAY